jgi:hypothetical protein
MSTCFAIDQIHIGFLQVGETHLWFKLRLRLKFLSKWLNFELTTKKVYHNFFIKFNDSLNLLAPFSRKIFTFISASIGSIVTYCWVLPLVKISAQLSKSPCICITNLVFGFSWYQRLNFFFAESAYEKKLNLYFLNSGKCLLLPWQPHQMQAFYWTIIADARFSNVI